MPDIDSLDIKITSSTAGAAKSIKTLTNALSDLKAKLDAMPLNSLNGLTDGLKELQSQQSAITSATKNIRDLTSSIRELRNASRRGIKMPTLTNPEPAETTETTSSVRTVDDATSNAASRLSELRASFSSFTASVRSDIDKIAQPIENRLVAKLMDLRYTAIKAFTWPITKAASSIKGLADHVRGLISGFRRILLYRAIRSVIKAITDSIKEGIQNLYQYSKAMNGTFAQAMDRASTSMKYFKNSLGAMLGPLITALVPVLDAVIDKVVEFLNYINQLIAKLTGASTWTRAIRYPTEYAAATNGAAGAVKKLKDYTLGIDELNVFNDDPTSSGHGSGAAEDYSRMFEEVETFADGIGDLVNVIKEKIKRGDWEGLGKFLGEKVNALSDKISTSTIGKKIGGKINNAISLVHGFLSETKFKALGAAFGKQVMDTIETIDFRKIGSTTSLAATSLFDVVIGFFSKIDTKVLGKKLSDFFEGAFNELNNWLKRQDFKKISSTLSKKMVQLLTNVKIGNIITSVVSIWFALFKANLELKAGFFQGIIEGWLEVDWGKVLKGLKETIERLAYTLVSGLGHSIASVAGIIQSILNKIPGVNIESNWEQDVIHALGVEEADRILGKPGSGSSGGSGLYGLIGAVGALSDADWSWTDNLFGGADANPFANIGSAFSNLFSGEGANFGENSAFHSNIIKPISNAFSTLFGKNGPVDQSANEGKENIKDRFRTLGDWFGINVQGRVKDRVIPKELGATAANAVWGIKEAFRGFSEWTSSKVKKPTENVFTRMFQPGSMILKSAESGANGITSAISKVQNFVSGKLIPNIKTEFSKFFNPETGTLRKESDKGASALENGFKNVSVWFKRNVSKPIGDQLDDVFNRRYVIGTTSSGNNISGWNINRVDTKANGGFISSGQLFFARENGINEMVGSVGNRNAVANNYQIEEGIARATERANAKMVNALYSVALQIVQAIEDNSIDFVIGDEQIGMANARYQQKSGTNTSRGAFANAY